jgi:general L-amino acid transport system substrate-binding protein
MGRLTFAGNAVLVVVASLALAGCLHSGDDGQVNLLDEVKERGTLECGVNDAVPGFGFVTAGGEYQGFDIDFCRAVAAGVLGDANAVEFVPLTAEQRFTALQAREIDVLIRNTTRTSSRDGSEGATFLTTTFYDGQGMMVRADSNYQELGDMGGRSVFSPARPPS